MKEQTLLWDEGEPLAALPPVTLEIAFKDLFGRRSIDITEESRKDRWRQWLALADDECREYWSDTEGCEGCIFLEGAWCGMMGLPAAVNPYLSFRTGMIGMACYGAGKQTKEEP